MHAVTKPWRVELAGVLDDCGAHAVRLAVLRSDNGGLAYGPTTGVQLLVSVLVLLLAAHEGLVHFDRPVHLRAAILEPLADPLCQMPSARLSES